MTAAKKQAERRKTAGKDVPQPLWRTESRPVPYDSALAFMEEKARMIREKGDPDLVWLLEHPPLYTAGTSADRKDLLQPEFPVFDAGRGGQYTYHGPGQRVAYVMIDLQKREADLKKYICDLESWVIDALESFGIRGARRAGRVGIWVDMQPYGGSAGEEAKIAAIGLRVRKWVAFHGVSINVDPDLSHYRGIVPCGISDQGVTSMAALGIGASLQDLDRALMKSWGRIFG